MVRAGDSLSAWHLAVPLLLTGLGNGVLVTPLLNAVLSRVRPAEIGMASGVLSTGQQIGGSVGVAVLGVIFYGSLGEGVHRVSRPTGTRWPRPWSSTWRRPPPSWPCCACSRVRRIPAAEPRSGTGARPFRRSRYRARHRVP
ncbi:hypothetical protein ACFWMU_23875 [Streptomyces sp. NPDC058357]|uniref:hypothetical protein n=1 Tax=unclassified Streptomyces TaxID=2593676 RepID=UPI003668A1B7